MGVQSYSESILLVTLPKEPQLSDELETVNEIVSNKCDKDVVIDFSRVEILTSPNICNLIILNNLLSEYQHQLVLCNVPLQIKGIFVVTGLKEFFDFADDKLTALESLKCTSR